ncbi:MAG TPA: hypothetical protein VFT80_01420 [Actinomycetota bacterium]|nr:hypothetical protein [Actinomycetota bacterium]
MSDDTTATGEQEEAVEHQSIVSRILEYQRQLREGDPPPPPVETLPDRPLMEFVAAETLSAETADLVDLTEAEAALATESPSASQADDGTSPEEPVQAEEEVAPVVRLEPSAAREATENGVWAVPEPPAKDERDDTAERLAELEDVLRVVSETIGELRQRFQDMAVASDERLAELERIVERARRSTRV